MRLFLVLMSGLVVAVPSWGQEPSGAVLDARIENLGRRLSEQAEQNERLLDARRNETDAEIESVRAEIASKVS